jgi:PAS domain-containing protein
MAVTHRRFDDGTSLQIRFPTNGADADSPERLLLNAAEARHEAAILRHALDNLDLGVAIVDETGHLLHLNAALRTMIAQNLGLDLSDRGQMMPLHPADHGLWQSALTMAGADYAPTVMMVPGADEPPLLALSIFRGIHPGTVVVLAARLRSNFSDRDTDNLADAFGMSKDQAKLMASLASGQTLQEIASQRRVEATGNVISPFFDASGLRHALRRHQIATDNQARIASLVLNISAITRYPMEQAFSTKDEEEE